MSSPEESRNCTPEIDRISQLPDNVIDKILTRLPIIQAAKAAVLSRIWKLGWNNISSLEFDTSFGKKFVTSPYNWMLAICQTLMRHSGLIDGFRLCIPWLESFPEIGTLIQFLSRKKVQRLLICFTERDFQILPSYLFSCLQLRILALSRCVLLNPPYEFNGFSQMTTLVFQEVQIPNDFFELFVTNSPQLRVLWLHLCIFKELSSIEITAHNLRTFVYYGRKMSFCFTSVPLLVNVRIYYSDYERAGARQLNFDGVKRFYLHEFSTAVPALRKLEVNFNFLKTLKFDNLSSKSSQPPNCLQQLKELRVYNVWFADEEVVSSLLGMIRSSPNLQQLTVEIHKSDISAIPLQSLGLDRLDFSCNRLKRVELSCFNGTYAEILFVKFLLSKSPQLETVTIFPKDGVGDKEKLQILTEMLRLQRASAAAHVDFRDAELVRGSS